MRRVSEGGGKAERGGREVSGVDVSEEEEEEEEEKKKKNKVSPRMKRVH